MCRLLTGALFVILGMAVAQAQSGELGMRGGLANTQSHLLRPGKDSFTVAFFGGSITEAANGWRDGTAQWLQQQTSRPVCSINAAIGGTGSSLGVYRLRKDVLQHWPQLLFVEFAVNDFKDKRENILESMEGIVRQTWGMLPETDICFIYTISEAMAPHYEGNSMPVSVKAMEDLARHYNIPSINLAPRVLKLVRSGDLFFAGKNPTSRDSMFFSRDGVHPYPETGYRLYNETVRGALPQLLKGGKKQGHVLPKPFFSNAMATATLVAAGPEHVSGPTRPNSSGRDSITNRFSRFLSSAVHLTDSSQVLRFAFTGSKIGFYDIIGPSSGNLKVVVDGGSPRIISRFDRFCTFYRMHSFFIDSLPEGKHQVEVSLSTEKTDKEKILGKPVSGLANVADYEKQEWRVGYFLLQNSGSQPAISSVTVGQQYENIQKQLATGWNTFNTHSVISHVKLPEGLAINLRFKNNVISGNRFLHESYFSEKDPRPEHVVPGYHAWDGSYTELTIDWEGGQYKVETASEGDDLVALVTPLKLPPYKHHLLIEGAMLWNRTGNIQKKGNGLSANAGSKTWSVFTTAEVIDDPLPLSSPYLATLCNGVIGVSAGKQRSLAAIQALVQQKRKVFETNLDKHGRQKETYLAQQSVLAWNTIYDPQRNAVIAPVSRVWNTFFGGHYVLFDWDTYLSGLMAGYDNKALAYANIVEVTRTIDQWGMVPNYVSAHGFGSPDRSQPPVGSMAVYELYKKFGEKWLLDVTYNRLLTWNRWWPKHRDTNGFLCWGTNPVPPDAAANSWQGAGYETGLDNSPMYEGVPFDTVRHQMALADVGLMSLYVADCNYLALLADVLNKSADAKELRDRSAKYTASLQKLWNEEKGMFLNKRTDNGEWSFRLSPTLFYPLIGKAATPQQAERMVREHLLNEKEFWGEWVLPSIARNDTSFYQQDYWKGRIWAPLNFLVYQGLKNYPFPEVVKSLTEKSNNLLLKNWRETRGVFENYHASGIGRLPGEVPNRSDNFYHWGALLGYMYLLENTSSSQTK